MAISITDETRLKLDEITVNPNYVLEIDGFDEYFGAIDIRESLKYGDARLEYGGEGLFYGGTIELQGQNPLISIDQGGTSKTISQQLRPDQGIVTSISSVTVSLVDKAQLLSKLISPGILLEDLLGRKAKLYFGLADSRFPDDYTILFRGLIDDITSGPGMIDINISHPDNKKRQDIFEKADSELNGPINDSQTSITVLSTDNFLQETNGVTGSPDPAIRYFVRIDDEIIEYDTYTGSVFNVTQRGALGTTAVAHDDGAAVESFYILEDNAVDLSLKVMLSGTNGAWVEDQLITSYNIVFGSIVTDSIFFEGLDLLNDLGVTTGDYITTTGSVNPVNNVTNIPVTDVVSVPGGSYVVVSGAGFINEANNDLMRISFRSKYDTLGEGLGMTPDEVDITEHERIRDTFLVSEEYRFFLKDTVSAKEFLEKQIYAPIGAYAIPRKARSSIGFHVGPVPVEETRTLDITNVTNPDKLRLRRSLHRNFYNTIVHTFDESALEDKFLSGIINRSGDSSSRIPIGTRARRFEAKGMRTDLGGENTSNRIARRLLDRYKFAAEYIEDVRTTFKNGLTIEVGDLVVLDSGTGLQITDTAEGDRNKPSKFFEVVNKTLDLRGNAVKFSITDTSFDTNQRYGLVSPSSVITTGGTTTSLPIVDSFGAKFPFNEIKKWEDYVGLPIIVHDEDYTFNEEVTLTGIKVGNPSQLITTPLSMAAQDGWVVDIPPYSDSTDPKVNDTYKLFFCHLSAQVDVVSGADDLNFDVGPGDIDKFFIGGVVLVHSDDFTVASEEVEIEAIVGNTITVSSSLGFTPSSGMLVDFIGFPDGQPAYRYV